MNKILVKAGEILKKIIIGLVKLEEWLLGVMSIFIIGMFLYFWITNDPILK